MDDWRLRFAKLVSQGTGLEVPVVYAWTLAEGANTSNPLNIGPGRKYGTPEAAAKATVQLIQTSPNYSGIRTAAKTSNQQAQVDAIVASPWDAGHYRGGKLLQGTLVRARAELGTPPGTQVRVPGGGVVEDAPGGGSVTGAAGDLLGKLNPLAGIPEAITDATNRVVGGAKLGFSYFALTMLAGVLIVLGLARSMGIGVSDVVGTVVSRGRRTPDPIPY